MKLNQQVALLTNCGNPVGQAIACALAGEGAHISMCGLPRSSATLKAMAREVEGLGSRSLAQQTDVTNPLQVQTVVKATLENFGKIDILVNAIAEEKEFPRFLEQLPGSGWDEASYIPGVTIDVNGGSVMI